VSLRQPPINKLPIMADRIGGGAPPPPPPTPHHPQSSAGAPLQPTFHGFIASTMDALVLFEACLTGHMAHVPRRPHDRERTALIRSGHVFIYEEHSSGIKRWTDGVPWSPSRILGNFLLYRELDKPFQPGEKKRAMKKTKQENGGVTKPQSNSRSNSVPYNGMGPLPVPPPYGDNSTGGKEIERALVGSLVDSYQFKPDGLVKKTISVQYRGMQHHLVSYYNIDDVINKRLRTPMETQDLHHIQPRSQLISAGNFRAPVDDHELVLDDRTRMLLASGDSMSQHYGPTRSLSVPSVTPYGGWTPSAYQQSTHYPMSHPLAPPVTYAPAAPSPYVSPYDQSNAVPRMAVPPHYPSISMSQAGRRHSTIPGAPGYEPTMNGGGHGAYGPIGSMDRSQMNGTPVLPSSLGSQHMSHTPYNNSSLYEPPAGSAGPSQHGSMYDNGPRHSTGYESSASQHQNGGYDAQTAMFDTTGGGQTAGEYESSMASQQGMPSFDSGSDDNTSAALGAIDLNQPVGSADLSDGGHYPSFASHQSDFAPRGSHSQSTLGP
jgi:hypothetical protein